MPGAIEQGWLHPARELAFAPPGAACGAVGVRSGAGAIAGCCRLQLPLRTAVLSSQPRHPS